MKTTTSKTAFESKLQTARQLEEQARQIRAEVRDTIKSEEEAILKTMCDVVKASPEMTAREISRAMGETMSVHEVAGQLCCAAATSGHPRYRGIRSMAHDTMNAVASDIRVSERQITRKFAEVDESGAVIPGGRTFRTTESKNVYTIR